MNHAKKAEANRSEKDLSSLVLTLYSRFLPGFYLLEYALKTRTFTLINEKLGRNWFETQLDDTVNDPIFKAEIDIILKRKPKYYKLSPEKLVAESGLGLWVEFFNPRMYKLAKGSPIKIFSNLPADIKRGYIYRHLVKVKDFRNLLVHSRIPMILDTPETKYLDEIHNNFKILLELLSWLEENPVFPLSQFEQELSVIKSMLA